MFRHLLPLLLLSLLQPFCAAASRVALVIGVNSYRQLSENQQLTSPVNDAKDVAAALAGLGYTLITGAAVTEADREGITTATEAFASAARGAEAAVFYFSGHGIQVGEDNYLLPADTPRLSGYSVLKNRAVLLRDSVMTALEEAAVPNKVIILDCCRDNPFSAQLESALAQVGKGLRTKSVGEITGYGPGFYLAFATSPGQRADDGNGARNSPFTAALLQTLARSSGQDIDFLFREVKALLPNDQVCWTNHSLRYGFTLNAKVAPARAPSAAVVPAPAPPPQKIAPAQKPKLDAASEAANEEDKLKGKLEMDRAGQLLTTGVCIRNAGTKVIEYQTLEPSGWRTRTLAPGVEKVVILSYGSGIRVKQNGRFTRVSMTGFTQPHYEFNDPNLPNIERMASSRPNILRTLANGDVELD